MDNLQIDKEPILEFIDDIRKRFCGSDGDSGALIFRGEADCYPSVRSSLRRKLDGKFSEAGIDADCIFSSPSSHRLIAQEAAPYFGGGLVTGGEFEALAVLQHYGAPTGLIDFSGDWRVALYFACQEYMDKCGRIIFFSPDEAKARYGLAVRRPTAHQHDTSGRTVGREIEQESVLVSAELGEFKPLPCHIHRVPRAYKPHMLAWLRSQGISRESVYRDVHGYVSLLKDDDAWESIHVARRLIERSEFNGAEKVLNRLISMRLSLHIEQLGRIFFLLGKAIEKQGDSERALEKYGNACALLMHQTNGIESRLATRECAKVQGDRDLAERAIQSINSLW